MTTTPNSSGGEKAMADENLKRPQDRCEETIDATPHAAGPESDPQVETPTLDSRRLDWLDQHCAFVADQEYNIGPFAIGELRQMADAGLAADWANCVASRTASLPTRRRN